MIFPGRPGSSVPRFVRLSSLTKTRAGRWSVARRSACFSNARVARQNFERAAKLFRAAVRGTRTIRGFPRFEGVLAILRRASHGRVLHFQAGQLRTRGAVFPLHPRTDRKSVV